MILRNLTALALDALGRFSVILGRALAWPFLRLAEGCAALSRKVRP